MTTEERLKEVNDAIDEAYWKFCRMAKAGPPPLRLYQEREELRDQLARERGLNYQYRPDFTNIATTKETP